MEMELLPEDCFVHILSFTSPQDVFRSSLVSSTIRSMADSDAVWEKLLPPNYQKILPRLLSPLLFSSKKQLFVSFCQPHPIDGGNKILSIEKTTGKICYLLGARELSIAWGNSPLYWSWNQVQGSRFAEIAELRTISWLEIKGSISTGMLSPKTSYGAYLVVKIVDRAYGLDSLPSEVSVEVGDFKSQGTVYIRSQGKLKTPRDSHCEDEWFEIELGSFYNHGEGKSCDDEVKMCLKEVKGVHLKGGLVVEGISVRPKPSKDGGPISNIHIKLLG